MDALTSANAVTETIVAGQSAFPPDTKLIAGQGDSPMMNDEIPENKGMKTVTSENAFGMNEGSGPFHVMDRTALALNSFEVMTAMAGSLNRIVELLETQQHSDHVHVPVDVHGWPTGDAQSFTDSFDKTVNGPDWGELIEFPTPTSVVDFKELVDQQVRHKLRTLLRLMDSNDFMDVKAWIREQLDSDSITEFPTGVISIQRNIKGE